MSDPITLNEAEKDAVASYVAANPAQIRDVCKALRVQSDYEYGVATYAYALGRTHGRAHRESPTDRIAPGRETLASVGTPPFEDLPGALDVAHHFIEDTDRRNRGCQGIDLWRQGRHYSYLWVEAMVDLDLWEAYLLDVRTNIADQETRDYLFVFVGAGHRFDVEWHQKPIRFDAPGPEHRARFQEAMTWFTGRVEDSIQDAEAANRTRARASVGTA